VARGCWSTVLYFSVVSLCSRFVHNGSLFIKGHPSSTRAAASCTPARRAAAFNRPSQCDSGFGVHADILLLSRILVFPYVRVPS
jgi:hypothetical protein